MKTKLNLTIKREELVTAAKYQDAIDSGIKAIAELSGREITCQLGAVAQIKLLLGAKVSKTGEIDQQGVLIKWGYQISKKEINFSMESEIDTAVLTEIFSMYTDIVSIYLPTIINIVCSIKVANKQAEARIQQARECLQNL